MKRRKTLEIAGLTLLLLLMNCKDDAVNPYSPKDNPPVVVSFSASPTPVPMGMSVQFDIHATDDYGLSRAILDYLDNSSKDTIPLSGKNVTKQFSHQYADSGNYLPTLTVEDNIGQKAMKSTVVMVQGNQSPVIIAPDSLDGLEAAVSRASTAGWVTDAENDPVTMTVAPVSAGLNFALNPAKDSVVYSLTNPDDNGTKQAKVTVVDQRNRTVEKNINIIFAPRDDISGRVKDRFEGTYLAGLVPVVVMQGPYTGWAQLTNGTDSIRVAVDGAGNFAFPKVTSKTQTLRAFITNGTDSSFIATYTVPAGDRTFDIGVETNAGSGMPLWRVLDLYKIVNFRSWGSPAVPSWLTGIDLKNRASSYQFYLLGKDTLINGQQAYGFTPEQQAWIDTLVTNRILNYFPPGNRPRIVKGGPNDPVPGRMQQTPTGYRFVPDAGVALVSALRQFVSFGMISINDLNNDGVYDNATIFLGGGRGSSPPFGFFVPAVLQEFDSYIWGDGPPEDRYYDDKSIHSERTFLEYPTIVDKVGGWQVILETPGKTNDIEKRLFELLK